MSGSLTVPARTPTTWILNGRRGWMTPTTTPDAVVLTNVAGTRSPYQLRIDNRYRQPSLPLGTEFAAVSPGHPTEGLTTRQP